MVCENPAFNFDFWNEINHDSVVEVTCLMPNSISIPLTVSTSTSLHELKEVCWSIYLFKYFLFNCHNTKYIVIL